MSDPRAELRRLIAEKIDAKMHSERMEDHFDGQDYADAVMKLFVEVRRSEWLRPGYVIAELADAHLEGDTGARLSPRKATFVIQAEDADLLRRLRSDGRNPADRIRVMQYRALLAALHDLGVTHAALAEAVGCTTGDISQQILHHRRALRSDPVICSADAD